MDDKKEIIFEKFSRQYDTDIKDLKLKQESIIKPKMVLDKERDKKDE